MNDSVDRQRIGPCRAAVAVEAGKPLVIDQIEAGSCYINTYNLAPVEAPFGGLKSSGVGQVNGEVGIRGYCHAHPIITDTGKKAQGASTITMQVARNFLLPRDKTYERKIKEIILARRIEGVYEKAST